MRQLGLLMVVLAVMAGCTNGGEAQPLGPEALRDSDALPAAPPPVRGIRDRVGPPPPELHLRVATEPTDATTVDEVRDVVIDLHVSGTWASDDIGVEFVGPTGTVYERQMKRVPDSLQGVQVVTFRLPVAGTFISSYGMSGLWQARVWMNGQERTLQPFELKP